LKDERAWSWKGWERRARGFSALYLLLGWTISILLNEEEWMPADVNLFTTNALEEGKRQRKKGQEKECAADENRGVKGILKSQELLYRAANIFSYSEGMRKVDWIKQVFYMIKNTTTTLRDKRRLECRQEVRGDIKNNFKRTCPTPNNSLCEKISASVGKTAAQTVNKGGDMVDILLCGAPLP